MSWRRTSSIRKMPESLSSYWTSRRRELSEMFESHASCFTSQCRTSNQRFVSHTGSLSFKNLDRKRCLAAISHTDLKWILFLISTARMCIRLLLLFGHSWCVPAGFEDADLVLHFLAGGQGWSALEFFAYLFRMLLSLAGRQETRACVPVRPHGKGCLQREGPDQVDGIAMFVITSCKGHERMHDQLKLVDKIAMRVKQFVILAVKTHDWRGVWITTYQDQSKRTGRGCVESSSWLLFAVGMCLERGWLKEWIVCLWQGAWAVPKQRNQTSDLNSQEILSRTSVETVVDVDTRGLSKTLLSWRLSKAIKAEFTEILRQKFKRRNDLKASSISTSVKAEIYTTDTLSKK